MPAICLALALLALLVVAVAVADARVPLRIRGWATVRTPDAPPPYREVPRPAPRRPVRAHADVARPAHVRAGHAVAAGRWLHGVDVSSWNHVWRWKRVRTSGHVFAIMKATEGRDWTDRKYARNRRRALRAGLVVAAYHFARPDRHARDARIEADHFLRVARVRAGDIVPVLDLETNGDLTRRQLIHWTWAWLNEVRR